MTQSGFRSLQTSRTSLTVPWPCWWRMLYCTARPADACSRTTRSSPLRTLTSMPSTRIVRAHSGRSRSAMPDHFPFKKLRTGYKFFRAFTPASVSVLGSFRMFSPCGMQVPTCRPARGSDSSKESM